MLGRLLIGIVKGLIVGGLLGFAIAKLGFAAPGAIIAYVAAALAGILIGLVAGKPIWAKDAKIEAGMKAFVGALLATGLMYAVRRWLADVPLPVAIGPIGETQPGTVGTIESLAITSLAVVTAALGGFYEADNTPSEPGRADASEPSEATSGKRIASAEADGVTEDEVEPEAERKRTKKS